MGSIFVGRFDTPYKDCRDVDIKLLNIVCHLGYGRSLMSGVVVGYNTNTDKVWTLWENYFYVTAGGNSLLYKQPEITKWAPTPESRLPKNLAVVGSFIPPSEEFCKCVQRDYLRDLLLDKFYESNS